MEKKKRISFAFTLLLTLHCIANACTLEWTIFTHAYELWDIFFGACWYSLKKRGKNIFWTRRKNLSITFLPNLFPIAAGLWTFTTSALHHHRSPIKRPNANSSIKGEKSSSHTMKISDPCPAACVCTCQPYAGGACQWINLSFGGFNESWNNIYRDDLCTCGLNNLSHCETMLSKT